MFTAYVQFGLFGRRARWIWACAIVLVAGETLHHIASGRTPRAAYPLDQPFSSGCATTTTKTSEARENAVIVMVARNGDATKAAQAVTSMEKHFNAAYHYPYVFLNNEAWDPDFIAAVTSQTNASVQFDTISEDSWGFPHEVDQEAARESMQRQAYEGVLYGGIEDYHHMCRFNSGPLFHHPALRQYKWYWRLDSDVEYTCNISYDPFRAMSDQGKRYGYAMALWERGDTVPTLFKTIDAWREEMGRSTTSLYSALVDASWAPLPLRWLLTSLNGRNRHGDAWNFCHFWSNFEIADMDFFRGKEYSEFFQMLDEHGGFYSERWGDAAVHTFGVSLFLDPSEVHYFEDIGYVHDGIQRCPNDTSPAADGSSRGSGCDCTCRADARPLDVFCQSQLDWVLR